MKRRKREREADEREVLGQRRKRESSSSNFEGSYVYGTAAGYYITLCPAITFTIEDLNYIYIRDQDQKVFTITCDCVYLVVSPPMLNSL